MIKYLCKRILDGNDDIIGYNVMMKVDTNQRPNDNDYDILMGADEYRYRMASFIVDEWVIVEDSVAKTAAETKETDGADRQTEFKKLDQFITNYNNATTIAQLKNVLKPMLRRIVEELTK